MESRIAQNVLDTVVGMVPHWYEASFGPESKTLQLQQASKTFYTHTNLTPALRKWLQSVQSRLEGYANFLSTAPFPGAWQLIEEALVITWLHQQESSVNWTKLLKYAQSSNDRTYENTSVSFNLIINSDQGYCDLDLRSAQKLFDPLAGSLFTFFTVDKEFNVVSLNEVTWDEISEPTDYKFYPDFLHPLVSKMAEDQYGVSRTSRGDLVIVNKQGLLAAKRKGSWKIYDCQTFKNQLKYCFGGNHRLACNLFETMFDLSFRRHGALLVYDPSNTVLDQVINSSSRISDPINQPDPSRQLLANSIADIRLDQSTDKLRKRLLLDVCGLDGAMLFNANGITALGAMIKSHPNVSSLSGARTTAAESAFMWGGTALKVSSDGEISIYFSSFDANFASRTNARLNIL